MGILETLTKKHDPRRRVIIKGVAAAPFEIYRYIGEKKEPTTPMISARPGTTSFDFAFGSGEVVLPNAHNASGRLFLNFSDSGIQRIWLSHRPGIAEAFRLFYIASNADRLFLTALEFRERPEAILPRLSLGFLTAREYIEGSNPELGFFKEFELGNPMKGHKAEIGWERYDCHRFEWDGTSYL